MLNASFGTPRIVRRVRRTLTDQAGPATAAPTDDRRRPLAVVRSLARAARLLPRHDRPVATPVHRGPAAHRTMTGRFGQERIVAVAVAAIVLVASAATSAAGGPTPPPGPVGGPEGDGPAPRIAIGGAVDVERTGVVYGDIGRPDQVEGLTRIVPADILAGVPEPTAGSDSAGPAPAGGPFLEDGTLLKPIIVDTTVPDGRDLLRTYTVKSGDTLAGIAKRHDVSLATLWWANKLKTKALRKGQVLTIPPVDGLVVTVRASDTLAALATTHKVDADAILAANELDDPTLVVGQVLILPGAKGDPLPKPKPTPKPVTRTTVRYTGASLRWPVAGGTISQRYHYGHYGLDIAADHGTRVLASGGGKVIFAGWKSNGGGYQVWISHGSNVYTTYNHLSSVSVGTGQAVGRGQLIGRIGSTGYSTGPHLHFEVWIGPIWDGGRRVNPLSYL